MDHKPELLYTGYGPEDKPGAAAPTKPAERAQLTEGMRLGKYTVVALLGQGGMGQVYKAFDPVIEREVALKVLPGELASKPGIMQRFLAEARAVGKLNHPHIVSLYDIGFEIVRSEPLHFLVLEFVRGGSLHDLIKTEGRIEWRRATRLIAQAAMGLGAVHSVGMLHRDIKPENLLRTAADEVKISDFGITKVLDEAAGSGSLTRPGELLGTPLYMSPEQCNGGAIDLRTDIYSLGVTYYQLLTGRRPFEDGLTVWQTMFAHCYKAIPDPRVLAPDLPPGCGAIMIKCMAKNPDERYQTAGELAAALTDLLANPPPGSTAPVKVSIPVPPVTQGIGPSPTVSDVPPEFSAAGLGIWVVEPSRVQARIVQGLLGELGATDIRTFTTAAQALEALESGPPDVVISAMHLDDGTGEQLAAAIRETHPDRTRFVLLSSSPEAAPGHSPSSPVIVTKPFTKRALGKALHREPPDHPRA